MSVYTMTIFIEYELLMRGHDNSGVDGENDLAISPRPLLVLVESRRIRNSVGGVVYLDDPDDGVGDTSRYQHVTILPTGVYSKREGSL